MVMQTPLRPGDETDSCARTFTLQTLGAFELRYGDRVLPSPTTKKARALLAYLIMHGDGNVSRERLCERFWSNFERARARDNFKVTLLAVRRCLRDGGLDARDVIYADRSVVRWIAPATIDVHRFERLADRDGDLAAAAEAISMYTGDFLEGDFDDWTVTVRERLAARYETLLGRVAAGSNDVNAAQLLIGRNPYDEAAYVALAEAELRVGRPRAAADIVQRYRAALAELGGTPSEDFERRFGSLHLPDTLAGASLDVPLVARDAEIDAIEGVLATARASRPSAAVVYGRAGIGVTAVVREGLRRARASGFRTAVCDGHRDLAALLREVDDDAGEGERTGARVPIVIAIDDATAADLDAIGHAARWAGERAGCLLVGTRIETYAQVRASLGVLSSVIDVRLGPLRERDVATALRRATGTDLATLASALYARTQGHPGEVREVLAALVADGTLHRVDGAWTADVPTAALHVPERLRSQVVSQLHALGRDAASVACALAIDPSATAAELGEVLGYDVVRIAIALDALFASEIVVEGDEATPVFSSSTVRDVARAMLGPARRTLLHAAFARVLADDGETVLRRARHLVEAGDVDSAGAAYLQATRASLGRRAPQAALAYVREGIAAIERLDRSPARDALLARLYRARASAALATVAIAEALDAAGRALEHARGGGDDTAVVDSLVTRAAIHGWSGRLIEQSIDASDAVELARGARDRRRHARALVEAGTAARVSGARERAVDLHRQAYEIARSAGDWSVAQAACAQNVLTCATWWDFGAAQSWLRASQEAALRASGLASAVHYDACAALWLLMARFDDAHRVLGFAAQLIDEAAHGASIDDDDLPRPLLAFFNRYMCVELAVARRDFGEAVALADTFEPQLRSSMLPVQNRAIAMLRVDALLGRDAPGDRAAARALCATLRPERSGQSVIGMSRCVELTRALVAATFGDTDARALLRIALDAVEENAHRTPLESDRAFASVAYAARRIDDVEIAARAWTRHLLLRARRRSAAGIAWGDDDEPLPEATSANKVAIRCRSSDTSPSPS
ncbi:MAG: hypothetical protein NVS1B2_21940 [Vulcanimicrobiaceae bacterium]